MTGEQAKRIGRIIAIARRHKGWSIRRLAAETGLTHTWLYKLERGAYHLPAPDRLTRVAEMLRIDPERIDRATEGHLSNSLPGLRTYFRSKYELSTEEIDQIERTVEDVRSHHNNT